MKMNKVKNSQELEMALHFAVGNLLINIRPNLMSHLKILKELWFHTVKPTQLDNIFQTKRQAMLLHNITFINIIKLLLILLIIYPLMPLCKLLTQKWKFYILINGNYRDMIKLVPCYASKIIEDGGQDLWWMSLIACLSSIINMDQP